jgi:hypothetical protein
MKFSASVSHWCAAVCSVLVLMFASVSPAHGSNVSVGCTGAAGVSDFSRISDAVAANPGGNVNIFVSGVCTEAVLFVGVENVQLIGMPGAALVDPGGVPAFGAVLEIDDSHNINIQTLTIQVAARGLDSQIPVVAISNSTVDFRSARLEGAGPSDGIDIFQSNVRLFGATVIENNNDGQGDGEGVFVQGPSSNLLLRRDPAGNCPLIQNNGDSGIMLTGSGAHVGINGMFACATIQNNGTGIWALQGATINLTSFQASPNPIQVLNNTIGVVAVVGAQLGINGPVLIQGNTIAGIRLRNAHGGLGTAPDGVAGPIIQQNGTAPSVISSSFCCVLPAGISVSNNADLDLAAGTVINNSAPGLLIQDNSSTRVIGSLGTLSISQNPVGISVTNVSSVALFLAPSVSGNATFDVSCGPDSVAYGDLSAVGKTSCQQFKSLPNPVQPTKAGRIKAQP